MFGDLRSATALEAPPLTCKIRTDLHHNNRCFFYFSVKFCVAAVALHHPFVTAPWGVVPLWCCLKTENQFQRRQPSIMFATILPLCSLLERALPPPPLPPMASRRAPLAIAPHPDELEG